MMTIEGLFGAGDAVGGTPHAFSSGSFTEGRLSAKAACRYIDDGKGEGIVVSDKRINELKEKSISQWSITKFIATKLLLVMLILIISIHGRVWTDCRN